MLSASELSFPLTQPGILCAQSQDSLNSCKQSVVALSQVPSSTPLSVQTLCLFFSIRSVNTFQNSV